MQTVVKKGDLVVSSKVLGHISEGLYRGPAGVFKELVSNAFDANARTIWISTGRPRFDVVSIRDDGDGMTIEKFMELVNGGIGDSDKRATSAKLINGRKVIGRLGIGILGVSQISHEFVIESHSRISQAAFQATISMKDFRSEILDQNRVEDFETEGSDQETRRSYQVGGYEFEQIQFKPERIGVTLTATDPTEGFRYQLAEQEPRPLPKDFREFSTRNQGKDVLATGPWYDRMVWQVASMVPIQYMSGSTAAEGTTGMRDISKDLVDFDFNVIVDGIKLFKPLLLDGPVTEVPPDNVGEGDGPFQFPLELEETVWGSTLRVRGYVYGSAGKALHPDDIRGLSIRLNHVGIGEYDKSFLSYRYAEGPRFAWLTGELFVENGLEDALTVGRDGFDIGHPHYIRLREWLHDELRSRVFPTLHRGMASRRSTREEIRLRSRTEAFAELISDYAGKPMDIVRIDDRTSSPIQIDLEAGTVTLNTAATWPRGKRQIENTQHLSIIFELVRLASSEQDATDDFIELTRKFLTQS